MPLGTPHDYTQSHKPEVLAELDSRLNEWANDIPEHLLWNPYNKNEIFLEQSAALYATYYHWRIIIHRPFLQGQNTGHLRSLAICTNAARSVATVASVKSRRGAAPNYMMLKPAFDSAIVLLLNMFGATRSGLQLDVERELVNVYNCMALLRRTEPRHQIAGRLYDCLCELLNISKFPFPPDMPPRENAAAEQQSSENYGVESSQENFDHMAHDHLSLAVEDLENVPIYGSLSLSNSRGLAIHAPPVPQLQPSLGGSCPEQYDMPDGVFEGDQYYPMQQWVPYFSSVEWATQEMYKAGAGTCGT
ncbi:hypothetical protein R3P38DRAFT_3283550 [Favolaschia claudopus]|uniref:Transcription factor domain-containing protein n=1 Tax=Favolaschia claudopus TaxID=2862362 RepID=A0AAW0A774_9AGAR